MNYSVAKINVVYGGAMIGELKGLPSHSLSITSLIEVPSLPNSLSYILALLLNTKSQV